MAANLKQAQRMVDAARKHEVRLMVNYPIYWIPAIWKAAHLAKDGTIGNLFEVEVRPAHRGPKEVGCSNLEVQAILEAGALSMQKEETIFMNQQSKGIYSFSH